MTDKTKPDPPRPVQQHVDQIVDDLSKGRVTPKQRGEIGWDRLVQARADVEVLATTAEADPLLGAAERYSGVRRYAPALLDAFTFRSARAQDSLLTAIDLLRQLNRDDRRGLPAKVPLGHLTQKVRKLIAANGKRDRRLWEIATLAVLRERLRSGEVWVEGGRAFRPLDAQLMPGPAFAARKEAQLDGRLIFGQRRER